MPKLRNGATDLEMFVQWIGRKINNHNPLAELHMNPSMRAAQPRTYKSTSPIRPVVSVNMAARKTLVVRSGNRFFAIEAREIDAAEYEEVQKELVAA